MRVDCYAARRQTISARALGHTISTRMPAERGAYAQRTSYMEELLESIVNQNERILYALEQISTKLDILENIEHEISWHKDLTSASQVISAIREVSETIGSQ